MRGTPSRLGTMVWQEMNAAGKMSELLNDTLSEPGKAPEAENLLKTNARKPRFLSPRSLEHTEYKPFNGIFQNLDS